MALHEIAIRLPDQTEVRAMRYDGAGDFDMEIVGESFHQDVLKSIFWVGHGVSLADKLALLVPDDDNPYDPNAVGVYINLQLVGYLSRDDAREYRRQMEGHWLDIGALRVMAKAIGGYDGKSIGVVLDLDFPLPDAED